jgi:hypothetical protein
VGRTPAIDEDEELVKIRLRRRGEPPGESVVEARGDERTLAPRRDGAVLT